MAQSWQVTGGQGITVHGKGGSSIPFQIEIQNGASPKLRVLSKLNESGEVKEVLILPNGDYKVIITVPPAGPVIKTQNVTVTPGGPEIPIVTTSSSAAQQKQGPILTPSSGRLTVEGTGQQGQAIKIVITPNSGVIPATPWTGNLGTTGSGSQTFTMPAGTYDVEVTAPNPGGTVYEFLGEVVPA
jgi:hypothetical protein